MKRLKLRRKAGNLFGMPLIARVLLEHGANVVALNNDCSIPLDICKSDEIRELFIQEINGKGIDLKDARRGEEIRMLEDAKQWLASGAVDEILHPVTGATAVHVAACKGYIKVLEYVIKINVGESHSYQITPRRKQVRKI